MSGQVTGYDFTPMNYLLETQRNASCSRSLYLSNNMDILSPVNVEAFFPIVDIYKGLDRYVWFAIITALIALFIIHKLSNSLKQYSVFDFIWIYFKPLLMIGEALGHRNYLYLIWLICITHLVYVIQNDLLSHIVTRPEIYADTIEDLLDDRYEVYTDLWKYNAWRKPSFYNTFGNNTFRDNFVKLVTTRLRTWDIKQLMDGSSEITTSPQKMRKFFNNKVLIQDQNWMDVIVPYFPRFMAIHVGQQYLSVPITPLCVGPTFQFINQSNVM